MTIRKNITYVTPRVDTTDDCYRILSEKNVDCYHKKFIEELFPLLSDPKFTTDLIVIDVEQFYNTAGAQVFDIVQTLSTLINCTVTRPEVGKPIKRNTKIIALVDETTSPRLIKEMLSYPAIATVALRSGPNVTQDELRDSLTALLSDNFGLHKKIQGWLKPKKAQSIIPSVTKIMLTPRQEQILQLIRSRGASNKIIAKTLGISESTVKLHIAGIFKKYGVRNRTQLAVFALED